MYSGAGGIFDVKKINSNVGYSGKNNKTNLFTFQYGLL